MQGGMKMKNYRPYEHVAAQTEVRGTKRRCARAFSCRLRSQDVSEDSKHPHLVCSPYLMLCSHGCYQDTLWQLAQLYCLPEQVAQLRRTLYAEYSALHNEQHSNIPSRLVKALTSYLLLGGG